MEKNSEFVAVIRWSREDLESALIDQGFKPSEENIQRLIKNRLGRTLEEQSIASGWEIISDIITFTDDLEPDEQDEE